MIDREKVHSLVGVFYQPEFKTFYVNSEDGKNFIKPVGVFVSLGMTTSRKVIDNICSVIDGSEEYSAKVVEILSNKIDGRFLNKITNDVNPEQYLITKTTESGLMTKDEAEEELKELRKNLNPEMPLKVINSAVPKVSQLQYFIESLTKGNGWEAHKIQKLDNGEYRIYHLYINYQKRDKSEYRLGIYVTEKKKTS